MNSVFTPEKTWWIRTIALFLAGIGFFLFGIQLLVSAYHLNDPFYFILTFFSSNLIILISAAVFIGLGWQMVLAVRDTDDPEDEPSEMDKD
ncbi:hypothetical protein D3OALGA1CA_2131 [Olavius algarvensis associated proteobacterium Delta 3]|nr:hypothetical protein D3OALGB2SA_680 [Olavius algarvensis associated proteobacterium Delta 3]CAB5112846.1 hypothetical protein D3OALGA1CA_2131 [Olavius algarvensis associated proteobacterium Delta 3]